MLALELDDSFAAYLRQSISQGFADKIKAFAEGVKQRGLFSQIASQALGDGSASARELLFNQKQLLKVGERYLPEKPWIAYFAATKHILFLRSKGITTASFTEFRDKEYSDEVDRYAESIAVAAEKQLDSQTQEFLHELLTLQAVEPVVDQAIAGLNILKDMTVEERHVFLHPEADDRSYMRKVWEDGGRDVLKLAFGLSSRAINAAANALKQNPENWVMSPEETISYLQELKPRRSFLEDTYLQL